METARRVVIDDFFRQKCIFEYYLMILSVVVHILNIHVSDDLLYPLIIIQQCDFLYVYKTIEIIEQIVMFITQYKF